MTRPTSPLTRLILQGPLAAYVCRSCGTEIVNKSAFIRCPVCRIKLD